MDKIWSNYTPKHIKLHHFFIKILGGVCPQGPDPLQLGMQL